MHADPKHPGLKKYREIRAKEKALAILRKTVRESNPDFSDSQVQRIAEDSYAIQNKGR